MEAKTSSIRRQQTLRKRLAASVAAVTALLSLSASVHADVSSSRLSLPKGPGSIEGLASTDVTPLLSTGSANYSVPIVLPPSARGFSPSLAFAYSSGAGVSELGMGWRLSGLPRIVRRTNEGLPRFDETDAFGLVGLGAPSDLIEVAEGVYRPQYEDGSFLRVHRDQARDEWWVRAKSGVTLVFGGAGYTESEGALVASYLLKEQLDLRGNRISFEWNTDDGYALLTRIVWNDFSKVARNEVLIEYETRPDPSTLYASGIRQHLTQRIEHIQVLHGGELVRRYEPRYTRDAHPRLEALTLVGADGMSKLPAARFEYSGAHLALDGSSASAELIALEQAPGRSPGQTNATLADLNGDALPDLLIAEAGNYRSYINRDGKSFASGVNWNEADSPSVSLSQTGIQLADVDGDGSIDLLAKSGTSSLRYFTHPSETAFGEVRTITANLNISLESPDVRLTDMDGDRRTDVLYTDATGLYVAYNQGGEDWALPEWVGTIDDSQERLFSSPEVELCDINGDRLKDICVLRSGALTYYLGRGRGLLAQAQKASGVPPFDSTERFQLMDLNGDGWDDLVRVGAASVFYALAIGEGAYADVQTIDGVPENTGSVHVEFADMNASGTTDILWVDVSGGSATAWRYLELFPQGRAGLLTRIENALGKVQRLEYAPAATFAAQDREEGNPWTTRINVPLPVVSRVSVDSSLDDPLMTTEFRYRNGSYDPSERTFAGFGVGITSALGDQTTPSLVTEQHFDLGLVHRGLRGVTTLEETRTDDNLVFSRSLFDFTYTQLGSGLDGTFIDYGYRSSVLSTIVEGDEEAARTTYAEVIQDEYGNVIEERNWGEIDGDEYGVGRDETITVRTFANNEEDWVLGRLATEQVTDIGGNRLAAQRNYYDGESSHGLPLGQITRGDITREEVWVGPDDADFQLQNATKYDDHGLPVETRNARGGGRYLEWSDDQTSLVAETVKLEGKVELTERAKVDARFGNVTSVTTYNGQERRYEYDVFGRVIKVIEPGDTTDLPTIEYRYEVRAPLSRVVTLSRVTSGKKSVERSESLFDGLGRKRATLTQDGERWVIAGVEFFDARGNAFRTVSPRWTRDGEYETPDLLTHENAHHSWFDAIGRPVRTLSPEGVESRTEYGVFEERHWDGGQADAGAPYEHTPTVTLTGAHGKVIEHRRTLDGEVLAARYERNPLGQLVLRRDPEGNEQRYEYDGLGRLVRLVDPDMGEHRMRYDATDNLLTHEHPDGKTTDFTYDLADRVLTEDWDGDGEDELRYFYDELAEDADGSDHSDDGDHEGHQLGVGKLLRVEEPTGFIQHQYDQRSQVVQTEYHIDGESYVVRSEFDAQGRERVHVYPDGSRIRIKRNGRGQLSGYGDDAAKIEYRGDGLETVRRFNTGVEFKNRYDKDQRRRELEILGHDGETLEHLEWDFDPGGNLLRLRDQRPNISPGKDRSEEYSYDNLYRLTGARGTWGNTEWQYSVSGNLLRRESTIQAQNTLNISYGKRPHAPSAYGDQEIEYDQRGRMKSDGERAYQWNGTDQLVRVQKGDNWTESEYGMDGVRRIRREHTKDVTQTTHFIDAWSEVKDGELVRYIVHTEKRIAVLAAEDERTQAKSLAAPPFQKDAGRLWREQNREAAERTLQNLQKLSALSQNLPHVLISMLLMSVLGGLAWLAWWRTPLLGAWSRGRPALRFGLLLSAALVFGSCSGHGSENGAESSQSDDDQKTDEEGDPKNDDVVWIDKLTAADQIILTDLIGSSLGETNGLGERQTEVALYPFGLAHHDNSIQTNVYADNPRDRSVGLDHMGARFYAPELGVWTSADPAILVKPEQYVTAEFAAGNAYAYANLRPTIAADRDGQFWHIAAGAAVGALIGGGVEAARQYVSTGKVEDWGRVGSAAAGGAVAGTVAAANPVVGLASMMGVGAASGAAGGLTTRLVQSGGKDAGTLTDVAVDAGLGAATAGIVKGGSTVLRRVTPAKPVAPPTSRGVVGSVGGTSAPQIKATQSYWPPNRGFLGSPRPTKLVPQRPRPGQSRRGPSRVSTRRACSTKRATIAFFTQPFTL